MVTFVMKMCCIMYYFASFENDEHFKLKCTIINRVFPKLTDLTFLSFLYKIDITGFQNQQKKICLHWVLNSQHQPHY